MLLIVFFVSAAINVRKLLKNQQRRSEMEKLRETVDSSSAPDAEGRVAAHSRQSVASVADGARISTPRFEFNASISNPLHHASASQAQETSADTDDAAAAERREKLKTLMRGDTERAARLRLDSTTS